MDKEQTRKAISDTITDMVSDLLYYDRKEDSDLAVGDIEEAISSGIITVDEMARLFTEELVKGLKP